MSFAGEPALSPAAHLEATEGFGKAAFLAILPICGTSHV